MKCKKHDFEMDERECSKCLGDGVTIVQCELTGCETPEKCWVCGGSGMGGWSCDACADEEEWRNNPSHT